MPPTKALRATRSDGERTRRDILATAARLATVEGIRHLSISRLADEVGISKSGLYAHFGSKEELQLATIDTAEEIYGRDVYDRIATVPAGLDGAIALADAHLDHMRRRVFPGGCFFDAAAGDLALERGIVRDKVAAFQEGWVARLRVNLEAAVAKGELPPGRRPRPGPLRHHVVPRARALTARVRRQRQRPPARRAGGPAAARTGIAAGLAVR